MIPSYLNSVEDDGLSSCQLLFFSGYCFYLLGRVSGTYVARPLQLYYKWIEFFFRLRVQWAGEQRRSVYGGNGSWLSTYSGEWMEKKKGGCSTAIHFFVFRQ